MIIVQNLSAKLSFIRRMNGRVYGVLLFTLTLTVSLQAQDLTALEDSIAGAYKKLRESTTDEQRTIYSENMRNWFIESFNREGVFDHPFASLDMGKLISSDQRIRILNWNQPNEDGSFRYYAFIMIHDSAKGSLSWVELTDSQREPDKPESKFMNADKWLGALYYEIIPMGAKRKKPADTYVLLGWDGKDDLTTRKVVDALTISGIQKIRLGAAIFESSEGIRKRIIMEYSNEVSASLKYYPKKKCIVMDHLSPKSPMLAGVFPDYGPDGTYDLLQLEKGKWKLYENIDISQFVADDPRPYVQPRQR
jgi:hypothetical protein